MRHLKNDVVGAAISAMLADAGYINSETPRTHWCEDCEKGWFAYCDRNGGNFTHFPEVVLQPEPLKSNLEAVCLAFYEEHIDEFPEALEIVPNLKNLLPESTETVKVDWTDETGEVQEENTMQTYNKFVKAEGFKEAKREANKRINEKSSEASSSNKDSDLTTIKTRG